MNWKKEIEHFLLLLICCFHVCCGIAQSQQEIDDLHGEVPGSITDEQGRELAPDLELETSSDYYEKKDINLVTRDQLRLLDFLSEIQMEAFENYRAVNGPITDLHELQSIPGWDLQTAKEAAGKFYLNQGRIDIRNIFKSPPFHALITISSLRTFDKNNPESIFSESQFAGDQWNRRFRIRSSLGDHLKMAIVAEKDAGEKILNPKIKLPDRFGGYLSLTDCGKIRQVIWGDYLINIGQGLIQGQSSAYGLLDEVSGIKRQFAILKPYSGYAEQKFHRGMAIDFRSGPLEYLAFVSYRKHDAVLESDTNSVFNGQIKYFSNSGLHRMIPEINNRGNVLVTSGGIRIGWSKDVFHVGITFLKHHFSRCFERQAGLQKLYDFAGSSIKNLGVDMEYTRRNFHLFSEIGKSQKAGVAIIFGAITSLHAQIDWSMLLGYFSPRYYSWNSTIFFSNVDPSNQIGILNMLKWKFNEKWQMTATFSSSTSPWLKYQIFRPAQHFENNLRIVYKLNKKENLSFFIGNIQNEVGGNVLGNFIPSNGLENQTKVGFLFSEQQNEGLDYQLGCGIKKYQLPNARLCHYGFHISGEFSSKFRTFPIKLKSKIIFFNADDYQTAVYERNWGFERAISYRSLYGSGMGAQIYVDWKWGRKLNLSLKYSQIQYFTHENYTFYNKHLPNRCVYEGGIFCMIKI